MIALTCVGPILYSLSDQISTDDSILMREHRDENKLGSHYKRVGEHKAVSMVRGIHWRSRNLFI